MRLTFARKLAAAWPLPALVAWGACWALFAALRTLGAPLALAFTVAGILGAALALHAATPWRRTFVAGGFPLSLVAAGLAGPLPGWIWLLPLLLLLLAYPARAWRDAPLFPTPTGALRGLAQAVPLNPGARILDAGCGLGAGLIELRREYPHAELAGIEWSWPLRLACAWRCRDARVRRADLWAASWADFDLVYLFQRPESLPRAITKARADMRPGSWLASLEFAAPGLRPDRVLNDGAARPVWLYRVPFVQLPAETP
jgi:SAM-dependent methyltransferase